MQRVDNSQSTHTHGTDNRPCSNYTGKSQHSPPKTSDFRLHATCTRRATQPNYIERRSRLNLCFRTQFLAALDCGSHPVDHGFRRRRRRHGHICLTKNERIKQCRTHYDERLVRLSVVSTRPKHRTVDQQQRGAPLKPIRPNR